MALTELQLKALNPKGKAYRIADAHGLCIEVRPTGAKFWCYRYRLGGKLQMATPSKYPLVTLSEARKKRDQAKTLLEVGKSPTREKKAVKMRNALSGENSLEALARRWLDHKHKSTNERYHEQCIKRMETHVFPIIGDLPISEITIPDVVRVLEKIGQHGTIETGKRIKQIMSQTFRYAAQRGLCIHNPAADLRDILPSTPSKHFSCIAVSELPQLLKDMDAHQCDKVSKLAMQFLALTFVRTEELIGAKWGEIDWSREEWHIPIERMKMKYPHVVPLSRQALAILKELQTLSGDKSNIFYSPRSKSRHISNGIILMALRRMGYRGRMTGHGFRSLASTILNERNYLPDVIERQLAHEDSNRIRSAYNHAEYLLERKKMMQDYADILDGMKKNNYDNITTLNRRTSYC